MRYKFEDLIDEMKSIKEASNVAMGGRREISVKKQIKKPMIRPDFSRSLFTLPGG